MSSFQMIHPTQDEDSLLFDKQITVYFDGSPAEPQELNYPGCAAEMEIESVEDEDGNEVTLSAEEEAAVDDYFWEHTDDIFPEPGYDED